jgi:hypothetical protein
MKRIILAAILILPLLSLIGWVIWGVTRDKKLASVNDVSTNIPAMTTNPINGSPAK